jgi:lipopolysaccharide transport system ATP-binding protein
MSAIIEVDQLGKLYRLGSIGTTSIRDTIGKWFGRQAKVPAHSLMIPASRAGDEPNAFWAVRDVSFDVQQGQVVGIIGRNGAGKSTLLKLLSRITEPTHGRAVLGGRVASLLEVGTGFHPDLTGRENIFLNGAILGMKRTEIAQKFDEIVEFAEIGPFLDTPVKRYSSGMYVRLAFAVAAHLEPEILVVDEVLAVGDVAFQKKCLGKMQDVATRGRTVLFVSHNMGAVQSLCNHAVMLENGRVTSVGDTRTVLARYLERGGEDSDTWTRGADELPRILQLENVRMRLDGEPPRQLLHVEMHLRTTAPHRPAFISVDILNSLGVSVMQAIPTIAPFISDTSPEHTVHVTIELPPLIPGRYSLTLWAGPHFTEPYDMIARAVGFEVDRSPTKGRTFEHAPDHGYVVPASSYTYVPGGASAAIATASV